MKSRLIIFLISILAMTATFAPGHAAKAPRHTPLDRPELDSIRRASCDPQSQYYYPKLLKSFLSNDTTMNSVDFQYFYYGTLFQEDYDPYRKPYRPGDLEDLSHIYSKPETNRSDRARILNYATAALHDNPVDLKQLTNLIYVYEKNGKYDLSKIWQYKLNHLLKVIAKSGTGADGENAWTVVYPSHEYDFLNLSGNVVLDHSYIEPYEVISCRPVKDPKATPQQYYFNIEPMLEQYYLKHPEEATEQEP